MKLLLTELCMPDLTVRKALLEIILDADIYQQKGCGQYP